MSASTMSTSAMNRILVLGSGGREHALAWKLSQDAAVEKVFVMPGNPGMSGAAREDSKKIQPLLESLNLDQTIQFCQSQKIDWVMVGPEKYLIEDWVTGLAKAGIPACGPSAKAAQLEGSKRFSKQLMIESGVPTARFFEAKTLETAIAGLEKTSNWRGIVVKLSGPALGKGVVVTSSRNEAKAVIESFFKSSTPGAEDGVVIEEQLTGAEASLFFACIDEDFRYLASASDHKRLENGDRGPNTGGMGAISPSPFATEALIQHASDHVVRPILRAMKDRGMPFRGILFVGLMGNEVLEFNVRLGDPETQALLPIVDGEWNRLLNSIAAGDVNGMLSARLTNSGFTSIHVVKAARGYPTSATESGAPLEFKAKTATQNQNQHERYQWFFAGIKSESKRWVTHGGRVVGLTAWALGTKAAQSLAYQNINEVQFSGEQYRTDIGHMGLAKTPTRVAVLASGSGSNAMELLRHAQSLDQIHIPIVVVDRAQAPVIQKVKEQFPGVRVEVITDAVSSVREQKMIAALRAEKIDWCCLAGFMRILSSDFLKAFQDPKGFYRVMNIHPSLLPDFPGLNGYQQAFDAKVARSGVSIHLVDEGMDTGPILLQESFPRLPGDTLESFETRGRALEVSLYPQALELLDQRVTLIAVVDRSQASGPSAQLFWVYYTGDEISLTQWKELAPRLTDTVDQTFIVNPKLEELTGDLSVGEWIRFLPGVTDNPAHAFQELLQFEPQFRGFTHGRKVQVVSGEICAKGKRKWNRFDSRGWAPDFRGCAQI
jgi:phosphoribosylamine---glycine ligase